MPKSAYQTVPIGHSGRVAVWRPPDLPTADNIRLWRTCSYCGSMHPADLLDALRAGATLHGAPWTLGWPHKFYVEGIYNPAGGPARLSGRWYNEHLLDDGYTLDEWQNVRSAIYRATDIFFEIDPSDGRLVVKAPYYGYHKP